MEETESALNPTQESDRSLDVVLHVRVLSDLKLQELSGLHWLGEFC
jgi:hypothetical protein